MKAARLLYGKRQREQLSSGWGAGVEEGGGRG